MDPFGQDLDVKQTRIGLSKVVGTRECPPGSRLLEEAHDGLKLEKLFDEMIIEKFVEICVD